MVFFTIIVHAFSDRTNVFFARPRTRNAAISNDVNKNRIRDKNFITRRRVSVLRGLHVCASYTLAHAA